MQKDENGFSVRLHTNLEYNIGGFSGYPAYTVGTFYDKKQVKNIKISRKEYYAKSHCTKIH
jgi:hypothetical protein